jgi:hypothetical protein
MTDSQEQPSQLGKIAQFSSFNHAAWEPGKDSLTSQAAQLYDSSHPRALGCA